MPEALTYQEMLRTLGTLLDQAAIKIATIKLDAEGAYVSADGWPWPRVWDLEAIQAQAEAQRMWRYKKRRGRGPGRTAKRLRVLGAALDVDNQAPYLLMLDASVVRVEGRDDYHRTFEQRPLARRLSLAEHLRGQIAGE